MIKRITFIRVALSFLIVCLLVVPLDADAASEEYFKIKSFTVDSYSDSEYLSFNVGELLNYSGSAAAGNYEYFWQEGRQYGVYHIKHYFKEILYYRNQQILRCDGYILQSFIPSTNIDVFISSTLGDFINSYCQIKNVSKYYNVNVSGVDYRSGIDYIDVFIPNNRIGIISVRPVIEFDIIVDLEHVRNDASDHITSFTLKMIAECNEFEIELDGGNYVSTGDNSIINKIDIFISNLNSKFTELFDILEDDQEELINGFQGSGTDQASTNFDTSAGELHSAETQLTNVTNTSVNTYTDFAFDTTVLTTLGASLVYVVTWFTNFWDIGGLFTALLNIGLALFVAFFILRLRGK